MSPKPFQAAIVAAPILLFGWLCWQFLVPTGTFRVSWEPGQRSAFVDPLRPDQRVQAPTANGGGGMIQAIVGDPVYTFIHPPRRFQTVRVDITFRDIGVPIVEAGGLLKAGPDEAYQLQPLENDLIDRSAWHRLDENGLVLLQHDQTYSSIADFLTHPPAGNRIANYRYDGPLPAGTQRLLPSLDLEKNGIDFVVARYQTPQSAGLTMDAVATVYLDPSKALMQDGAWKLVISAPGASPSSPLVIRRIDVTMTRPDLVATLKSLLHL